MRARKISAPSIELYPLNKTLNAELIRKRKQRESRKKKERFQAMEERRHQRKLANIKYSSSKTEEVKRRAAAELQRLRADEEMFKHTEATKERRLQQRAGQSKIRLPKLRLFSRIQCEGQRNKKHNVCKRAQARTSMQTKVKRRAPGGTAG